MKYQTKQGKHGTLYRYAIDYRDSCDKFIGGTQYLWAYDIEHAEEKFYDAEDSYGWVAVSYKLVPEETNLMHRAKAHSLK